MVKWLKFVFSVDLRYPLLVHRFYFQEILGHSIIFLGLKVKDNIMFIFQHKLETNDLVKSADFWAGLESIQVVWELPIFSCPDMLPKRRYADLGI